MNFLELVTRVLHCELDMLVHRYHSFCFASQMNCASSPETPSAAASHDHGAILTMSSMTEAVQFSGVCQKMFTAVVKCSPYTKTV